MTRILALALSMCLISQESLGQSNSATTRGSDGDASHCLVFRGSGGNLERGNVCSRGIRCKIYIQDARGEFSVMDGFNANSEIVAFLDDSAPRHQGARVTRHMCVFYPDLVPDYY